jgi:peptidoglycan/LPS O-acetylase OafA/YrhL
MKNKKITLYLLIFAFIAFFSLYQIRPDFLNKYFFSYIHLSSEQMYNLSTFFIAGSVFTYLDISRFNRIAIRLLLLLLIVLSFYFNIYQFTAPFLLPLFLLMLGSLATPIICTIAKKFGDISYGVYIYGFLIQQTLLYCFQLNSISLMFLSIPITYGFAYLSWHFVEEKMLKYKNFIN